MERTKLRRHNRKQIRPRGLAGGVVWRRVKEATMGSSEKEGTRCSGQVMQNEMSCGWSCTNTLSKRASSPMSSCSSMHPHRRTLGSSVAHASTLSILACTRRSLWWWSVRSCQCSCQQRDRPPHYTCGDTNQQATKFMGACHGCASYQW